MEYSIVNSGPSHRSHERETSTIEGRRRLYKRVQSPFVGAGGSRTADSSRYSFRFYTGRSCHLSGALVNPPLFELAVGSRGGLEKGVFEGRKL